MGHPMLRAFSRNVRCGVVVGVPPQAGVGSRPDGNQAAVLLPSRRGYLFRVRVEGDSRTPIGAARTGSDGSGSISFGQLRSGRANINRRNPESTAGAFAGVEERPDTGRTVVAAQA